MLGSLSLNSLNFVNVTNATETEDLWLNSLTKGIKTPFFRTFESSPCKEGRKEARFTKQMIRDIGRSPERKLYGGLKQ
jgi:hypothetical protein